MALFSKERKTKTSITIDTLVHNTLKNLAKKDGRSLSNYVERIAVEHIERLQKGKQKEMK